MTDMGAGIFEAYREVESVCGKDASPSRSRPVRPTLGCFDEAWIGIFGGLGRASAA